MSNFNYPAIIKKDEQGVYQVTFPDFPGCFTFGHTYEEALTNAEDVLTLWISELAKVDLNSLRNAKTQTTISNISVQFA